MYWSLIVFERLLTLKRRLVTANVLFIHNIKFWYDNYIIAETRVNLKKMAKVDHENSLPSKGDSPYSPSINTFIRNLELSLSLESRCAVRFGHGHFFKKPLSRKLLPKSRLYFKGCLFTVVF